MVDPVQEPAPRSSSLWLMMVVAAAVVVGGWWFLRPNPAPTTPEADPAAATNAGAKVKRPRGSREPDKSPASIEGTVRGPDGAIAGARVCLRYGTSRVGLRLPVWPICTTADDQGAYRFDAVVPGRVGVNASARGMIPGGYESTNTIGRPTGHLRVAASEARTGVDIVLAGGGMRIAGVVEDLSGGAIEGAWVATSPSEWFFSGGAGLGAGVVTDAEGRFETWVEPGTVAVTARAEGYAPGRTTRRAPTDALKVLLTPESVIVGQVVAAGSGEPVADALVKVGGWDEASSTHSDVDGRFRLGELGPEHYDVIATTDDGYGEAASKVAVGFAQTSDPIVVRLHPAYSIRGRVVLAGTAGDTEIGCPGARVQLSETTTKRRLRLDAGERDGEVIARGVQPGVYELNVSCGGRIAEREYEDVEITDASVIGLRWEVTEGKVLRGTVVDAAGQPIADASVTATPNDTTDALRARQNSEKTDTDGVFAIVGLVPGPTQVRVRVDGRPSPPDPLEIEVPEAADPDPVEIQMPASGRLDGTVVGEDGTPVANVSVGTKFEGPGWDWKRVRTDENGAFEFEHLALGRHRVRATVGWRENLRAPGSTDDDEQGEVVEVSAQRPASVRLVVEARSSTIRGTVTMSDGAPVGDAFITAERESDSKASATGSALRRSSWGSWNREPVLSDQDGRFELTGLTEGSYAIRARRKGGGDGAVEGVETGTETAITIDDTSSVSGRVIVPGGEPPLRFNVRLSDATAGVYRRDEFFQTRGLFEFPEVVAGTYELTLTSPEGDAKLEDVVVEPGVSVEGLEVKLDPRIRVTGRLIDIDTRQPVPRLLVSVNSGNGFSVSMRDFVADRPEVSDTDGRFTVGNAPVGKVTLMIMPVDRADPDQKYDWGWKPTRIPAGVTEHDVGDIEVIQRRTERNEKAGDLGIKWKEDPPKTEPEDRTSVIAFVRPGGPAAKAGLVEGDDVATVDGHSVVGADSWRRNTLTNVSEGKTVTFGLADGRTIKVIVGPPLAE